MEETFPQGMDLTVYVAQFRTIWCANELLSPSLKFKSVWGTKLLALNLASPRRLSRLWVNFSFPFRGSPAEDTGNLHEILLEDIKCSPQ